MCAVPARAFSGRYLSFTSPSIFSTAMDTTFARPRFSNASSSCNACFIHPSGFATPTISWNMGKNCSRWRNKMAWKGSSPSAPTARTFLTEARIGRS